jgi:signal transduction histidine kinase/DNA-binding NarL/FixJ family response regulator/tetratricopeptide (TPR) repeat protein
VHRNLRLYSRLKLVKKLTILLFVICFIISFSTIDTAAQSNQDSLFTRWQNNQDHDTTRLKAFNEYIRSGFLLSKPDSALKLSAIQLEFAKKAAFKKFIGDAYSNQGVCYTLTGKHEDAIVVHKKALQIWNETNDLKNKGRTLNHLAIVYNQQGNYIEALENYFESLKINEALNNKAGIAAAQNNIGLIYYEQAYRSKDKKLKEGNYQKALVRLEESYKLRLELGVKRDIIHSLGNIGAIYIVQKRFADAEKNYLQSLEMSRELNDLVGQSSALNNLGAVYHNLGDNTEVVSEKDSLYLLANEHYNQAFEIRKAIGNPSNIAGTLINLAIINRLRSEYQSPADKLKMLNKAIEQVEPALKMFQEIGAIHEIRSASEELTALYKLTGQYEKALAAYEVYIVARDSINSVSSREDVIKQELTYDFEKKALEEDLRYQVELRDQKNRLNISLAGGALLLFLALFLFNRFRLKQRTALQLEEKNKEVEAARYRAERSEAVKQQFLANMSHEIRTPMNAITGLSRLLLDKPHDAQTTEYLKAISHSSENLLVVLNDILDLSKIDAGKLQVENIIVDLKNELKSLENIYSERAKAKNLQFSVNLENSIPPYIFSDPVRLMQILGNLISNAIKFTDKGSVNLSARLFSEQENKLIFIVSDTGRGIASAQLSSIFERFSQANASDSRVFGGTGLGLTIASQLATQMGGKLDVKSTEGEGAQFILELPIQIAPAPAVIASTPNMANNEVVIHLLVAEDNDYNFIVTRDTVLKYFPSTNIVWVKNGEEAIHALGEDEYDLVLMDVQMPQIDGYEATRQIRKLNQKTPILGLTASVINADLEKCIASGMNAYISKPFKESDLIEAISNALGLTAINPIQSAGKAEREKQLFLEIIPGRIEQLKAARINNQMQEVVNIAHAIRPQIAANGLFDIDKLCEEIEVLSSGGASVDEKAEVLIEKLEHITDQLNHG